jgi:hypothetical protein
MEHMPPELSVGSKLKVISAESAKTLGDMPRVIVDAAERHYRVTYVPPRGDPPLEAGQWLHVVTPAQMVKAVRLNARSEPEGGEYGLYDWELL